MCADISTEREDSGEIRLQYFVPIIIRELMSWVPSLDSTAVDEDVDLVSVRKYFRNELLDRWLRR